MRWDAQAIHAAIHWPDVLERLGIDPASLSGTHGPCPNCGGEDRFRFDDRHGRGDFYCNGCGPGDGFSLLQRVHGWAFAEARFQVIQAAGLGGPRPQLTQRRAPAVKPNEPARPTARVKYLRRTATTADAVPDVIDYLRSRLLWPLPNGCTLQAHPFAKYWNSTSDRQKCVGRYPALLAEVRDIDNELVTLHATYLEHGDKLGREGCPPRKLLSKLSGRHGCAIRLMPVAGDELGIAEGIESALAANMLHDGIPVWSAINTTLLAKFEPPPRIHRVIVFADRDVAGLEAALKLTERLVGRATVEIRSAPRPANDWHDVLVAKAPA